MNALKYSASALNASKLRVWYQLPFSIKPGAEADLGAAGWNECPSQCSPSQKHYFHPFVAGALWDGSEDKDALFKRYTKPKLQGRTFRAWFEKPVLENGEIKVTRQGFNGKIRSVELRCLPASAYGASDPGAVDGFGMLVLCVDYLGASHAADETVPQADYAAGNLEALPKTFGPMTLADAQDLLDLSRRIFPRWHSRLAPNLPGDTFFHVDVSGSAPSQDEMSKAGKEGRIALMPWVKNLAAPYDLADKNSFLFGDERSYVASAILLGDGTEKFDKAFDLSAGVRESDLFRLAELDQRGEGYLYGKPFLEGLAPSYFYRRHAPDAETRTGNTSHFITGPLHLCALGAGGYFRDEILGGKGEDAQGHIDEYYRHMQFLCIFEYYRLIQFSMALTRLVRARKSAKSDTPEAREKRDEAFEKGLTGIRNEFLEFTHLHHFSNVSSQLQPREMFARLYAAFGIGEMFAEVEKELEAATGFHEMQAGARSRERGEQLNKLVSLGVPLSLLVGLGGMNILIGDKAPFGFAESGAGVRLQLAQLAAMVAVVLGVWGIAVQWFNRKTQPAWLWIAGISALIAVILRWK